MASDNFARVLALAALDDSELKSLEERVDELARIGFKPLIVEELPTEGMDSHTLYLVPNTGEQENDYDEYLWFEDTGWELMGTTSVDLSNYVTLDGNETISGVKTFTALPQSDVIPSNDNELINKKYIDDLLVDNKVYFIEDNSSTNPFVFSEHSTGIYYFNTKTESSNPVYFKRTNAFTGTISLYMAPNTPLCYYKDVNTTSSGIVARVQWDQFENGTNYYEATENFSISNNTAGINHQQTTTYVRIATVDTPQTITGTKTFTTLPQSNVTPATANQFTTKSYVDNAIAEANNVYVLSTMNNTQQNPVILANCKPGIFVGGTDDHTMLYLKLFEEDPNTYGLDLYYGGENCFYYTTDLSQYDYETYTGTVEFGYTLLPVVSPEDGSKVTNGITRYIYYGRDHSVDSAVTKAQQEYVKTSGAQTINGVKTFTSLPESSATPENDNQLVNKLYTDTAVSSAIDDRFFYGTDLEWNELTQEQQDDFLLAVVYPAYVELTPEDQSNLGSIVGSDELVVSDMSEEDAIAATDEIIGGSNG